MAITPKEVIEVPAKTYDKLWVSSLSIDASLGGEANARFVFTPYSETDGFYPAGAFQIELNGILGKIEAGDTQLAEAFSAIMAIAQREINK